MTIPELIDLLLGNLRNQWYPDRPREYRRDQRALTMAIARWGYECHTRGWEFDPEFILHRIIDLLQSIKRTGAEITYLPLYLERAIDQHLRERAEEYRLEAMSAGTHARKVAARVQAAPGVREPAPVEVLATLYRDLKKRHAIGRKKQPKPAVQKELKL